LLKLPTADFILIKNPVKKTRPPLLIEIKSVNHPGLKILFLIQPVPKLGLGTNPSSEPAINRKPIQLRVFNAAGILNPGKYLLGKARNKTGFVRTNDIG
jgi:hypothetical protein